MENEYLQRCKIEFATLFNSAKKRDEFEYVCSLLRIRGMESAGWDPSQETQALMRDMSGLLNSPLNDVTKLRLALLTYSHITEIESMYTVIENLLSVAEGKRCSISPFLPHHVPLPKMRRTTFRQTRPPSSGKVVDIIAQHAEDIGFKGIADVLEQMFDENIRNAFFHSDYILYDDEFRSKDTNLVKKIPELIDLMNRGMGFYSAFMEIYEEHITSYKESKRVMARITGDGNSPVEVELTVGPEGVNGFKSIQV